MSYITDYLDVMYERTDPYEFYRDVFPKGTLQMAGVYEKGKYNGIFVSVTDQKHKKKMKNGITKDVPIVKRYTITDDQEVLSEAIEGDYFCLCSPIAYAGKERSAQNARLLFGIAVDLDAIRHTGKDGMIPVGLINLMTKHVADAKRVPAPTYIVSSGTGVHLYYLFERPLPLYPAFAKSLEVYKRTLTKLLWHETIVDIESEKDIQYESIFQGFRMPGTRTKISKEDRAVAYRVGERVSMEYMNSFVTADRQAILKYESKHTLEQAKELYPEWYEHRVIEGRTERITRPWCVNRRVYEWWKRQIYEGAIVSHRYWCLWILAVYAEKCSHYDPVKNPDPVTLDELTDDAYGFMEYLDGLTVEETNHFTEMDVLDALEGFQDALNTYPLGSIEYHSAIKIDRNKRNGRKQKDHLERARWLQQYDDPSGDWRNRDGRPTAEGIIREYLESHPDCRKIDVIRDLGLSRPTVYKWWGVIRDGKAIDANNKTVQNQSTEMDDIAAKYDLYSSDVVILNVEDEQLIEKIRPYMPDRMGILRIVPVNEYAKIKKLKAYHSKIKALIM